MKVEKSGQSLEQIAKARRPYHRNSKVHPLDLKKAAKRARNPSAKERKLWSDVGDQLDETLESAE